MHGQLGLQKGGWVTRLLAALLLAVAMLGFAVPKRALATSVVREPYLSFEVDEGVRDLIVNGEVVSPLELRPARHGDTLAIDVVVADGYAVGGVMVDSPDAANIVRTPSGISFTIGWSDAKVVVRTEHVARREATLRVDADEGIAAVSLWVPDDTALAGGSVLPVDPHGGEARLPIGEIAKAWVDTMPGYRVSNVELLDGFGCIVTPIPFVESGSFILNVDWENAIVFIHTEKVAPTTGTLDVDAGDGVADLSLTLGNGATVHPQGSIVLPLNETIRVEFSLREGYGLEALELADEKGVNPLPFGSCGVGYCFSLSSERSLLAIRTRRSATPLSGTLDVAADDGVANLSLTLGDGTTVHPQGSIVLPLNETIRVEFSLREGYGLEALELADEKGVNPLPFGSCGVGYCFSLSSERSLLAIRTQRAATPLVGTVCLTMETSTYTYTGKAIKPALTVWNVHTRENLKSGTDYTLSYKNNTKVGTATVTVKGKGSWSGTMTATFKITAASIAKAKVTLPKASYAYTGKAIKPAPTVKLGKVTLKSGTDYTVAYKNNTKAGTATVTVKGKGNYAGSVSATFKITAASIAKAKVTLPMAKYAYTGKAIKPAPTVKLGNVTLKSGTDYTVAYKNNKKKGTATVTVTGKGNYAGSVSATFKIV